MIRFLYKRLLLAYLLAADQFRKNKKTLEEKYFPISQTIPSLIQYENVYRIYLNQWQPTEVSVPQLQIWASTANEDRFTPVTFEQKASFLQLKMPIQPGRILVKIADGNQSITIGERLLDMGGTVNFRDVGGLETKDGKRVKWNKLYRSGHLYKLSKREWTYFKTLDIGYVIDFRGPKVVKRFPDRLPDGANVHFQQLPLESKGLEMRKLGGKILRNDLADFDASAILKEAYSDFVNASQREIKAFFDTLLQAETGVLMHCSAGKDRTGFFMALLLLVLGVKKAYVERDFLASNHYRGAENQRLIEKARLFADATKLEPLLFVQLDYLKTALDSIEEKYGTIEQFLMKEIGITAAELRQLREKYLEE